MLEFIKTIINALKTYVDSKIVKSKSDWNQNDVSADNYIKNRPFYEHHEEVVIVDSLTSENWDNENSTLACNFIPGNFYKVIWNGETYDNLICEFNDGYNVICSKDDELPFYIDDDGGNDLWIESNNGDEQWSVSIIEYKTETKRIDEKYLPDYSDTYATVDSVNELEDAISTAQTTADLKMDKENPVGTGSFSMNRKSDSPIGNNSSAFGVDVVAETANLFVEGKYNKYLTNQFLKIRKDGVTTAYRGSSNIYYAYGTDISFDSEIGNFIVENVVGTSLWRYIPTGYYVSNAGRNDQYDLSNSRTSIVYYLNENSERRLDGNYCGYENVTIFESVPLTDGEKYAHIVGNGTSDTSRSNAHTLDWEGNAWFAGDVYVGSTSGTNRDEGSKKLASEEYVDNAVSNAGGDSTFMITVDNTLTADKTYDEIVEAYKSGKFCFVKHTDEYGYENNYVAIYQSDTESNGVIKFSGVIGTLLEQISISKAGNVSKYTTTYLTDSGYGSLNTTNKTIVGAINEINEKASNTDGGSNNIEVSEIVTDVLNALPTWTGGSY